MRDCICHVNLPFESTLESLKRKEVLLTLSMQAPKDNQINQIKINNNNMGKTFISKTLHKHVYTFYKITHVHYYMKLTCQ